MYILLKQFNLFQSYYKDTVFTGFSPCLCYMTNLCFTPLYLFIILIFHCFRCNNDRLLSVIDTEFIFFRNKTRTFQSLVFFFKNQHLLSQKYWLAAMPFHAHLRNLNGKQFPPFGQIPGSPREEQGLALNSYSIDCVSNTLVSSRFNLRNIFTFLFIFYLGTRVNVFFFFFFFWLFTLDFHNLCLKRVGEKYTRQFNLKWSVAECYHP